MADDDATRATNDDASSCKKSAVDRGYWKDPYIQYFMKSGERKTPEMNRGYYARVKAVQVLMRQFLELTDCQCQIVNLGAGFDTTYWNLKEEGLCPKNFIEVDFQGVTARKCYYIKTRKQLLEKLGTEDGDIKFNNFDLHAASYHVVGADMRNLEEFEKKLSECNLDKAIPTLFVAECVLVYMTAESSGRVIRWIGDNIPTAMFINYEQVNMSDRFGQVMIDNLKARSCNLAGVQHCASLETQQNRFTKNGWDGANALDMNTIYRFLPQADVQSYSLQGLGKLSELQDELFAHYCLCLAYRDRRKLGLANMSLTNIKMAEGSDRSEVERREMIQHGIDLKSEDKVLKHDDRTQDSLLQNVKLEPEET